MVYGALGSCDKNGERKGVEGKQRIYNGYTHTQHEFHSWVKNQELLVSIIKKNLFADNVSGLVLQGYFWNVIRQMHFLPSIRLGPIFEN